MKSKFLIGAILTAASAGVMAQGSPLSYTNVGLAYVKTDVDNFGDFSGYALSGSVELNESVFLLGSYASSDSDDDFFFAGQSSDVEVDQFALGLGFHSPISQVTDFVGSLSYADAEVEAFGFEEDDNGFILGAGVRSKPSDFWELSAGINYADIGDDDDTSLAVGARYFLAPEVSLGLDYSTSDDVDAIAFSLRFDL